MVENKEYFFSGAFGDAYIAFCKLSGLGTTSRPVKVRRLSKYGGFDRKIFEISSLFNGIQYIQSSLVFESVDKMRKFAFKNSERYINIYADGLGRNNEPDDPTHVSMNPFPDLNLSPPSLTSHEVSVGIQLHSGSSASGPRMFDVGWILDLAHELECSDRIGVIVLGTGKGYSQSEIDKLNKPPNNFRAIIKDDPISDWLERLASLDYLISPEGIASFFACSQKVPGFILYRKRSALLRMPSTWRKDSVCMRPHLLSGETQSHRWTAGPPDQLASLILARLDPEVA